MVLGLCYSYCCWQRSNWLFAYVSGDAVCAVICSCERSNLNLNLTVNCPFVGYYTDAVILRNLMSDDLTMVGVSVGSKGCGVLDCGCVRVNLVLTNRKSLSITDIIIII